MSVSATLKPPAWAELAAAHDGALAVGRRGRIKSVRVPHRDWAITLDTYTVSTGQSSTRYTRFRVRMGMRQEFRMRIYRENVFTRVAKWFGMQDIAVPHPEVDRAFIVQTDGPSYVNTLVLDAAFSDALLALRRGRLEVARVRRRGRRVPGIADLIWIRSGTLKDRHTLEGALKLMRATLDGLIRSGLAQEMVRS